MSARPSNGTLPFVKMHGAGNDFVVADNRGGSIPEPDKAGLARRACRRKFGVGADGLILIEPSRPGQDADFTMRYFNADGSEGELCGNGTRCAAVFAREIGAAGDRQRVATPAGVVGTEVLPTFGATAGVRVAMVRPRGLRRLRLSDLPGGPAELFALEVGVPHAVEVVADVGGVDVAARGAAIRRHPAFPAGANANFISLDASRGEIRLRTFERGVEAESLACGTGATAAAAVAHRFFDWPPAAGVRMASGDLLRISRADGSPLMEGPVVRVYGGVLPLASAGVDG